jgi:two-component sensor histidine kinase
MRTMETVLRQQSALAKFGSFAFRESELKRILPEAARVCAESLSVPYATISRYRARQNDLIIEAGYGWYTDVVGLVSSVADKSSTQVQALLTGQTVILEDLSKANTSSFPSFYAEHGVVATVDVLIKGKGGKPWGILEVDSDTPRAFYKHDIDFLTGFANVVAESVATAGRTSILHTTIELMETLIADKDRLLTERDALLHEKDVLAEELHHRVRNNLQIVFGMLNRQIDLSDEAGKEGIRSIARRIISLSTVYDHLLSNGLGRTIDFDRYLRSLCETLREVQDNREFGVALTCDAEPHPLPLDLDTVTALGIIVAEIVSNSYLHAFPGRAGAIHVILARGIAGPILTIGDDGVGFVEPATSKRHGLGLVRRLMQQIEGTVSVVSDHGTEWTIVLPTEMARIAA